MGPATEASQLSDRLFDVVVVGGGAAGSAAAYALGARGVDVAMIDTHDPFPQDLRADKVSGDQIDLLKRLGLFESVAAASVRSDSVVNMRRGRVLDRVRSTEYNLPYEDLVNAIRRQIPDRATFVLGRVADIETSADRQSVRLSTGETLAARLVVLSTGGGEALRAKIGIVRRDVRPKHSVTIAFDLEPVGRDHFDFETLTIYGDAPRDRVDYISIFPFPGGTRANLFLYRDLSDPFFALLKSDPVAACRSVLPDIDKAIGPFRIVGKTHARPVDVYEVEKVERPGVALIGDAYRTSCPAVGDGLSRCFTDVDRLCNVYAPRWLATPGMDAAKIAEFYRDDVKRACDARAAKSLEYRRNSTIGVGMGWTLHRRRVLLQRRLRALGALLTGPRAEAASG